MPNAVKSEKIIESVSQYYTQKIKTFGAKAQGADWNSQESQHLRFEQLLKIARTPHPFKILDYGCGYGELIKFLDKKSYTYDYRGYDISAEMVKAARKSNPHHIFFYSENELSPTDYVLGSGLFNVRLDHSCDSWEKYIFETLQKINRYATKGFAVNFLTSYSDPEKRREDLYYANPGKIFDFIKVNFASQVALLHDYGLYEFSVLARKDS